MTTSAVTTVRL